MYQLELAASPCSVYQLILYTFTIHAEYLVLLTALLTLADTVLRILFLSRWQTRRSTLLSSVLVSRASIKFTPWLSLD